MRVLLTVIGSLMWLTSSASAQPRVEVFGGYLFSRPDFEDVHLSAGDSMNGWMGGVGVLLAGHLGIVARVDGSYDGAFREGIVIRPLGDAVHPALYTYSAGPRVSAMNGPITLYADALFGAAHARARQSGIDFLSASVDTQFVGGAGGGIGVRLKRSVDFQFDLQYRRTNLFDQRLGVFQLGAGIAVALSGS